MSDDGVIPDDADDAVSLGQCDATDCTNAAAYKLHRCDEHPFTGRTTHIDSHLCCEEHYETLQEWADTKESRTLEIFDEVGDDA